jgi:hypothetical protein
MRTEYITNICMCAGRESIYTCIYISYCVLYENEVKSAVYVCICPCIEDFGMGYA